MDFARAFYVGGGVAVVLGISHTIWPEGHDPGWGLALIGIAIILLARRAINRRSKDRH